MTAAEVAVFALVVALVPCTAACLRGDIAARLVAMELAGVVVALATMLLSVVVGLPSLVDVAIVLAAVSFVGGLVFVRFLERWL